MNDRPFEHADPEVRSFYSKVFFNAILNINAVRMGFYPTLLCETDDPLAGVKWQEARPQVIQAMKQRQQKGY